MTSFVPRKLNTKNSNLDWINCICQIHDLQCDCGKPLIHTIQEIKKQEPSIDLKQCLGGGEDPTKEEDVIGPGDLEALFAGEFGEGEEDATTSRG